MININLNLVKKYINIYVFIKQSKFCKIPKLSFKNFKFLWTQLSSESVGQVQEAQQNETSLSPMSFIYVTINPINYQVWTTVTKQGICFKNVPE